MIQDKDIVCGTSSTEQVSNFNLKSSYWYINNKQRLRTALVVFLILLSVGFYAFTFYRAATIVFVDDHNLKSNLNELTSNAIDYTAFNRANQPQEIKILSFNAVTGANGRYDFIATVANPNDNFAATAVTVMLATDTQSLGEKIIFVLPGEQKLVGFFGQTVDRSANPTLKIVKTAWARQRSYKVFAEPRLKFATSDIVFQPTGANELPVSILKFKIANNSAFSYWQVGVYVALLSGGQVVGTNYISLDQFSSGQTRDVEFRWSENLPPVDDYLIVPEVNILDESVYMAVQ